MKHRIKCSCGSEMTVESSGNVDMGMWKKDSKGRWQKTKHPSRYQVTFLCGKGTCGNRRRVSGRGKSKVLARVNEKFQAQRRERIEKRKEAA